MLTSAEWLLLALMKYQWQLPFPVALSRLIRLEDLVAQ